MSNKLEVFGKITKVFDDVKGETAKGDWVKKDFMIEEDKGDFKNSYYFTVFSFDEDKKVENFTKYNKVGDAVKVSFNVKTNEWVSPQGQTKYFTSLNAYSIFKETGEANSEAVTLPPVTPVAVDDLPF
jgi:hypothetical protein